MQERIILNINEATQLIGCESIEILRAAQLLEVNIFTVTPEKIDVYNIRTALPAHLISECDASKNIFSDEFDLAPIHCPGIEFLVIPQHDLEKIIKTGSVVRGEFYKGAKFNHEYNLDLVTPEYPPTSSYALFPKQKSLSRSFSTSGNKPANNPSKKTYDRHPIEIRIDCLRILKSDIDKIKLKINRALALISGNQDNKTESKQNQEDRSINRRFTSLKLSLLYRTAKFFWSEDYQKNGADQYPSEDKIIQSLMDSESAKYSHTSAQRAASIIRPDYAKGTPTKTNETGEDRWISKEFRIVLEYATKYLDCPPEKWPSKKSIGADLEAKGLKIYKAQAAASIIYPDD